MVEQARFGCPVGFVRAVVIQVFVGDIGDYANVKLAGGDTLLSQPMRGGFEYHMGQAGCHHLRQVTLHVRRFRRGDMKTGINFLVADDSVDGRDHADPQPGGSRI